MNKNIAWIDDVHLLTVITDTIEMMIRQESEPTIYWRTKDRYFPLKIEKQVGDHSIQMTFDEELPMGEELILIYGALELPVYPRGIVRTEWFDANYSAMDQPMGVTCDEHKSSFRIWSPIATTVKLYLDNDIHQLNRQNSGMWVLDLEGDFHGTAYEYEVTVNGTTSMVNDPYAKGSYPNSEKGIVVDLSRTYQSTIGKPHFPNLQDAIIYELHVRDATIHPDSGVIAKGTFSGLTEKSTKTKKGFSTGLTYIKELGCTHVQLLPINDFARVDELKPRDSYNWGYDPMAFQVPEGSYSQLPADPVARINECKAMIDALHDTGLCVILDVVYNHVFIMEESPFEKLVPGYYFRYHEDGKVSNGTGVGNDLATEKRMVRKFILDTIDLWLTEYKADGFRFDLMGVMDVETMDAIHKRCNEESEPIMLLGEGWHLPTALSDDKKATSSQSWKLPGIRFFNDYFRDSLKGNLFDCDQLGFINGNGYHIERLPHLVTGSVLEEFGPSFVHDVSQTINYVECHDNHTLWDRLFLTNKEESDYVRKKMHQLATGIVLLSQGVPFIHAGQEWFRTKKGIENSYISGDEINQLDWTKREQESDSIEFVKSLIEIRKNHPVFRMTTKQEIRKRYRTLETPRPGFGFALLDFEGDLAVYLNPTHHHLDLQLPSPGTWLLMASNDFERMEAEKEVKGEHTHIGSHELLVLKKLR